MEKKFPNAKLASKRLYEENSQLCGEAVTNLMIFHR